MYRNFATIAAAFVFSAACATAQFLSVGPTMVFKGGVNAGNIPEGQKTGTNISVVPDFSATGLVRFAKESDMGATFDIGYSTYTYRMRPESEAASNDNNTFVHSISAVTITPGLYFAGFQLGAAFVFPSSYSVESLSGLTVPGTTTNGMNSPAVEIRVGGLIPLWKHEDGVLNAVLHGGYMVTGQNSNGGTYNPTPASFGIGLNYFFTVIR